MEEEKLHIITVYGIFKNNKLLDLDTGEILDCATYGILYPQIQDRTAFYNIKFTEYGDRIIFQYVDA